MVKSSAYPSLERKAGGPDNWVERVGGLPQYINRIAKHLVYERGFTISHAIATAVNTVKRWARKGTVVKWHDPKTNHVTVITAAQAAADVAEWEAKVAAAHALPRGIGRGKIGRKRSIGLAEEKLSITALAERANAIVDPRRKAEARARILELAVFTVGQRKTLAASGAAMPGGSFPIRNAQDLKNAILECGRAKDTAAAKRHIISRAKALGLTRLLPPAWLSGKTDLVAERVFLLDLALTKDGRQSFKGVGKRKAPYQWKHGFKPVTKAAVTSKAKGSPIAEKRITRLYGPGKAVGNPTQTPSGPRSVANKPGAGKVAAKPVKAVQASGQGTSTAKNAGQLRDVRKAAAPAKNRPDQRIVKDVSSGGSGRAGRSALATKSWGDIPDANKTIRNGKKYVLSSYNGKTQLVPWQGPEQAPVAAPDTNIKVSVTSRDAANMTTAQIRRLLKAQGKTQSSARKTLNAALRAKTKGQR
jgi:hypothetical protein